MAQLTSVAAMQREHGVKIAILGYFEVCPPFPTSYALDGWGVMGC